MTKALMLAVSFLFLFSSLRAEDTVLPAPHGVELRVRRSKDKSGHQDALIPYQPFRLQLAFDKETWGSNVIPFHKIKLHSLTINGKPIPAKDLAEMEYGGYGDATSEGPQWSQEFGSKRIFPVLPGQYKLDMIVKTPKGLWQMPPKDFQIIIPEGEGNAYSDMLAKDVPRFIDHPWGMRYVSVLLPDDVWWGVRPAEIPSAEQPPYAAVLGFVKKYPASTFTRLVFDRCLDSYAKDGRGDVGRLGVLPPFAHVDRMEIARLLVTIDQTQITKTVQRQLAVCRKGLSKKTDESRRQKMEAKLYWYQCWKELLEQVKMSVE